MSSDDRFDLQVWGERLLLEGFRSSELDELFEWFAGSIDLVDDRLDPSLIVRIVRSPVIPPSGLRSTVRHRGGISGRKFFLDGTPFDQASQTRDVDIVSDESPALCCYAVDGALLVTAREAVLVMAAEPPPMLLADLVENWLLWRAREAGAVMAHGSGWIHAGAVHMLVGHSGVGKTTELFRQVASTAEFFSNDRIALTLRDGTLVARNFPQPVNIGCGTIRALGMALPTFDLDDRSKIRLMPPEVLERWAPTYERWYPVEAIHTPSWETIQENVYWAGDPDHPFWNRALPPQALSERMDLEGAIKERLITGWQSPPAELESVGRGAQ